MYLALLIVLILAGISLIAWGVRSASRIRITAGVTVVVLTLAFFALLDFWGEMLWFEAIGYPQRFWTAITAQAGFALTGALTGVIIVFLLTIPTRKHGTMRLWTVLAAAAAGGLWGLLNWEVLLRYLYRVPTGTIDPVLGETTGFYLFVLPFLDALYELLLFIVVIALAATAALAFGAGDSQVSAEQRPAPSYGSLALPAAALALVMACGKLLNTYHLLFSKSGVVTGAGWTDLYIRYPAYFTVAIVTVILGIIPLVPAGRRRLAVWFERWQPREWPEPVFVVALPWVAILATWFLGLGALPALVQWLRVEPNEITLERPYIAHNIRFTRLGFDLAKIEERKFPLSARLTRQVVENNEDLISEVRLWDWRALDAVYQQFQEIRLYYEFPDVDVDRYHTSEGYRQVMVAPRELEIANLPEQSQTFVNRRFKYTHGYGLTLAPVSEFTANGLPRLLVKDIPPQSEDPKLEVKRPEIYYGELTDFPVYVNTEESEFNYPSGDENVYNRYDGNGGVELTSLWRKFLFGWKFDGTRFFLSSYPTRDSRVLFHRKIRDRVATLAPFLTLDRDPYIVLAEGRLFWIIDGYTTSRYFPYSEPFASTEVIEAQQGGQDRALSHSTVPSLDGVNYVRNSVKAVVDAFTGAVTFYVFDDQDPLLKVWQRIFPGLFQPREEMPETLLAHIRYPADLLLVQGLVYAKYHMTDPAVFYNQEDLWVRATEKYYSAIQPVSPYYVMWEPPEADNAEFILMLPFTPKNRQVLIGWIAGMCDPANYGRLLSYKFPKEERVLGPQQVETKIDQDRFLSGQLSLWDQRGSRVIRGNVLAIPIDRTLLYVEPIYLQAEAAAYPELRLVAIMHQDELSYADTFEEALEGLFENGKPRRQRSLVGRPGEPGLIQRAADAFDDYLRLQAEGNFVEAGQRLSTLQKVLEQLTEQQEQGREAAPSP